MSDFDKEAQTLPLFDSEQDINIEATPAPKKMLLKRSAPEASIEEAPKKLVLKKELIKSSEETAPAIAETEAPKKVLLKRAEDISLDEIETIDFASLEKTEEDSLLQDECETVDFASLDSKDIQNLKEESKTSEAQTVFDLNLHELADDELNAKLEEESITQEDDLKTVFLNLNRKEGDAPPKPPKRNEAVPKKILLQKNSDDLLNTKSQNSTEDNVPVLTENATKSVEEQSSENEAFQHNQEASDILSSSQFQTAELSIQEEISDEMLEDSIHDMDYSTLDTSLGQILSQQREKNKLSVKELSAKTRVKHDLILALEQGEYQLCPPLVYMKNNLRNLSDELNVPYDILLQHYCHESGQESQNIVVPDISNDIIEQSGFSRIFAIVAIVAILGLAIVGCAFLYFIEDQPVFNGEDLKIDSAITEKHFPQPKLPIPK